MRIRKRLHLSSLPSIPLSDPQLHRSPVVQVQQQQVQLHPHGNPHFQEFKTDSRSSDPPNPPSDQQMMIPDENSRWVSLINCIDAQKDLEGEEVNDERGGGVEEEKTGNNNNMRKECTLNAEADIDSSSSSDQDRRWDGEEKVVPLKKRRGSFERGRRGETANPKWKSKTNRKCVQQHDDDDDDDDDDKKITEEVDDNGENSGRNKRKRGNVIMEGSRCSRVNGRGWRCCQQTLVGYSLCEHHLGKGRLRSMSAVRNRSKIAPKDGGIQEEEEGNGEEKKGLSLMEVKKNKKMKIGKVKARSMSSILVETDNAAVVRTVYYSEKQ